MVLVFFFFFLGSDPFVLTPAIARYVGNGLVVQCIDNEEAMVKFKTIINGDKSFEKINIKSLNLSNANSLSSPLLSDDKETSHTTTVIDSSLPCYAHIQTGFPVNAFCICGPPSCLSPALFTFDRILFINQPSAVSLHASVALLTGYADPTENVNDPSFIIYPQKSINGIFALYLQPKKDKELDLNIKSNEAKEILSVFLKDEKPTSSTETSNSSIAFRPMNYRFPCPVPPLHNYTDEELSELTTLLLQVILCSEKVCEVCAV
jgi:hypothetical protein